MPAHRHKTLTNKYWHASECMYAENTAELRTIIIIIKGTNTIHDNIFEGAAAFFSYSWQVACNKTKWVKGIRWHANTMLSNLKSQTNIVWYIFISKSNLHIELRCVYCCGITSHATKIQVCTELRPPLPPLFSTLFMHAGKWNEQRIAPSCQHSC